MNLFNWIHIQAETMMKEWKTNDSRKLNPLLQTHFTNVQGIVKSIKDNGDIIQMQNQAQKIGRDDESTSGYQTVIYHGMTRSSDRKTFVQTLPDGTVKKWTESVA
jgi:hypothetical protein